MQGFFKIYNTYTLLCVYISKDKVKDMYFTPIFHSPHFKGYECRKQCYLCQIYMPRYFGTLIVLIKDVNRD